MRKYALWLELNFSHNAPRTACVASFTSLWYSRLTCAGSATHESVIISEKPRLTLKRSCAYGQGVSWKTIASNRESEIFESGVQVCPYMLTIYVTTKLVCERICLVRHIIDQCCEEISTLLTGESPHHRNMVEFSRFSEVLRCVWEKVSIHHRSPNIGFIGPQFTSFY